MPPIATGSMPPRLHPGRTDLACCCLFEGRQWVQERIKSLILPPVLPHPKKSILGHPGASFHRIPVESTRRRRTFRQPGVTGPLHGFEAMPYPFGLNPREGIRPDVASGCRQRQGRHTLPTRLQRFDAARAASRLGLLSAVVACLRAVSGSEARIKRSILPPTTTPQRIDSGPSWGLVCVGSRINLPAGAENAGNRGPRDRCMD